MSRLSQTIRKFWQAVTRRKSSSPATHPLPDVILHDPAANRPRDLDDPFIDVAVQARMAETIANATQKKK